MITEILLTTEYPKSSSLNLKSLILSRLFYAHIRRFYSNKHANRFTDMGKFFCGGSALLRTFQWNTLVRKN